MATGFTPYLKTLIAGGQVKTALHILADFFQNRDETLLNEVVLLLSNLEESERGYYDGVVSRADMTLAAAKSKKGALRLIDQTAAIPFDEKAVMARALDIRKAFQDQELPVLRGGFTRSRIGIAALAIAGFGAVFFTVYFSLISPESAESPTGTASSVVVPVQTLVDSMEQAKALYEKHVELVKAGAHETALTYLNQVLELQPGNAKYYNARADVLLITGQHYRAKQDATRATILDPYLGEAYVTLAQSCTGLNDTEGFYRNIEEALRKNFEVWHYDQQPGIREHAHEARYKDLINRYRN